MLVPLLLYAVPYLMLLAMILLAQGRTNRHRGRPLLHGWPSSLLYSLVVVALAWAITGPVMLPLLLTRWLFARSPLACGAALGLSYLIAFVWLGRSRRRGRGVPPPSRRPPSEGAA